MNILNGKKKLIFMVLFLFCLITIKAKNHKNLYSKVLVQKIGYIIKYENADSLVLMISLKGVMSSDLNINDIEKPNVHLQMENKRKNRNVCYFDFTFQNDLGIIGDPSSKMTYPTKNFIVQLHYTHLKEKEYRAIGDKVRYVIKCRNEKKKIKTL